MAKRAILYVDLLGVQKMWLEGGASAVKYRIEEFSDFVEDQLEWLPGELHRSGEYTAILSGDSIAVMCQDFNQAIGIGAHLFTQAFYCANKVSRPFWLRGAISGWSNQRLTDNPVPIKAKGLQVGTRYVAEDEYLAVLALEKSGFRGMRLLVDPGLLPDSGRNWTRTWAGFKQPLSIITRLRECPYPRGHEFADVLWMADDEDRYNDLCGMIAKRFKRAAADLDEFSQAAWTRVVFDQVASLIWKCRAYAADGGDQRAGTTEATRETAGPCSPPQDAPALAEPGADMEPKQNPLILDGDQDAPPPGQKAVRDEA